MSRVHKASDEIKDASERLMKASLALLQDDVAAARAELYAARAFAGRAYTVLGEELEIRRRTGDAEAIEVAKRSQAGGRP